MSQSTLLAKNLHHSLLRSLPPEERNAILNTLSDEECALLLYDWSFWAREVVAREDGTFGGQLPPERDWTTWLVMAGRGFGKTRTGAEFVRSKVERGEWRRVALVARTAADARDVMVEGESGLLSVCPPWFKPIYEPSKRRVTFPNGAIATTYSGDEPEQLRGPQHDGAWADELAAWRYPDTYDQLQFGLRLGTHPQQIITTTPRPIKLLKDVLADSSTVVTTGTTFENVDNLAPRFFQEIRKRYEGTRLGLQEMYAKLLTDAPGALWKREHIDGTRVHSLPELIRVVIAIDPAATSGEESNETGIVAAGIDKHEHGYILEDATLRASPAGWASQAIALYHKHHADRIVAEVNNGGEMVENTIRTVRDEQDKPIGRNVPYRHVRASRGKETRAEPVAALYEQGRVHHLGVFAELEDQMCQWVKGEKSPDRLDALVWALTELMINSGASANLLDIFSA